MLNKYTVWMKRTEGSSIVTPIITSLKTLSSKVCSICQNVAKCWVTVCICMSVSLKAGTNLPKNTRVITSLIGPSRDSGQTVYGILVAKITCCMLGQHWVCVLLTFLVFQWCCSAGIKPSVPFLYPSSPPLFHLFISRLSLISNSEIKSKHRGDGHGWCLRFSWCTKHLLSE